MLQYAATAGVVPLTLVNGADNNYNGDSSGILMHQETVEYDSIEKLIIEADRLLTDSEYHDKRAVEMKNAVISEDNFKNNLKVAIESHNSVLPIELYDIDTKWFRQQYLRRFCEKDIISAVAQPDQFSLFWDFPALFWKRAVGAFKKRLLK